ELKELRPLSTLLYELFHPYGFTETVLHDLVSSWDGNPGKVFKSGSHKLYLDRNLVILSRKETPVPAAKEINDEHISLEWSGQKFRSRVMDADEWQLNKEPGIAQL